MSMRHTESTLITRPVAPPVDLDAGRLDIVRAAAAAGFVLACLLIAAGAAWGFLAAQDARSGLGQALAGAVVVVCLLFGLVVAWLSVSEWTQQQQRIAEWHAAALVAYQEAGAETVQQISEWELTTANPAHVLIVALDIQRRIEAGSDTPHSVRALRGPLMLSGSRAGELSKSGAELMRQRLAALGLIEGSREGYAGHWVPRDYNDVVELVLGRWVPRRHGYGAEE
jgi:hypothetical protein